MFASASASKFNGDSNLYVYFAKDTMKNADVDTNVNVTCEQTFRPLNK